jgi:delta 1-pyrroline-5-carboxylate dehydrogenase
MSECPSQLLLTGRPLCHDTVQVILKPAESTPLTALALAELGHRAGIPNGVLNIVAGDAKAIGTPSLAPAQMEKTSHTSSGHQQPLKRPAL